MAIREFYSKRSESSISKEALRISARAAMHARRLSTIDPPPLLSNYSLLTADLSVLLNRCFNEEDFVFRGILFLRGRLFRTLPARAQAVVHKNTTGSRIKSAKVMDPLLDPIRKK